MRSTTTSRGSRWCVPNLASAIRNGRREERGVVELQVRRTCYDETFRVATSRVSRDTPIGTSGEITSAELAGTFVIFHRGPRQRDPPRPMTQRS